MFKNNRQTDQDELLGFMKPFFKPKKETTISPVFKALSKKFLTELIQNPEAVLVQPKHINQRDEDDDSSGWDESENEITLNHESPVIMGSKLNNNLDPHCMSIRKYFNEVDKEKQLNAMMHL